jgi:SAM-dependent methyltransferase
MSTNISLRGAKLRSPPTGRIINVIICSVCGGTTFSDQAVLWDALVVEWQLTSYERSYIDRQQGTCCLSCGANLRSVALSDAIRGAVGTDSTLREFCATHAASKLAVLEINEAGSLSPILGHLPGHVLAAYPNVDIHDLPYATDSFDLVVHSDTLEHVSNPLRALEECRRVLRPNGSLCFTVPTIVGRLTRSREGLPNSYHGGPETRAEDFKVHTEFGADAWMLPIQAGFSAVSTTTVDFPSALALTARKREGLPPATYDPPSVALSRALSRLTPSQVVSIHFPKAGGSSLHTQLAGLLGDDLVYDWTHDPLTPAGAEVGTFPAGKRIVHGHFRAQRYASANAYWMTFLRHPVDNLISIYFYWKSLHVPGHDLHARFLREKPSVVDFALFQGIQRLLSETYFGNFDMGRLDFIGFHETRDVDIRRLGAVLNLPLDTSHYVNKTADTIERSDVMQDPSIRRQLNDVLSQDVTLYERLRNRG